MIDVLDIVDLLRERSTPLDLRRHRPVFINERRMLNMLTSLVEQERELIVERVNA